MARRDGDRLWKKGALKERDGYWYVVHSFMKYLKEEHGCYADASVKEGLVLDEAAAEEAEAAAEAAAFALDEAAVGGNLTAEEEALNQTDVDCSMPESLDEVSERITELFWEEKAEYAAELEPIKARIAEAKAKIEAMGKEDEEWAQRKSKHMEIRKLKWMLKMLTGAKMGVAMHMAKWGKEMRDNRISNDAHRAEERRWKERGGGRDGRPFKHGWKPKRELPQLLAEIKEKARAKCAETDDVDACHKKMWLAWHKWLGREEGYGRYVRTKSELESELSDGGLEGPTAMQASTMLLRCLEAAEPRDEGESESACVEPQNYTESVLECEEFEPYEAQEASSPPKWMWCLLGVLAIVAATSCALLYACRCRGRAMFRQRRMMEAQQAQLASKIGGGVANVMPVLVGHQVAVMPQPVP